MKKIALFLLLFVSCNENKPVSNKLPTDTLIKKEGFSLSVPDDEMEKDTFPEWIKKIYNTTDSLYGYGNRRRVEKLAVVNDSVTWCILSINDGVCSNKILAVLVNKVQKQEELISEECDHELSYGIYSWKTFVEKKPADFEVTMYKESVADSLMDSDGRIKSKLNKDFLELDTKMDSVNYRVTVDNSGGIIIKGKPKKE